MYLRKGDGTTGGSWETAFNAIGDAVWVRHGVYNETIWLMTPVVLLGGFTGEGDLNDLGNSSQGTTTTIEANNPDGNPITCTADSNIDGFTLTGGELLGLAICLADVIVRNCRIVSNVSPTSGGGILITSVNVDIRNCRIEQNVAFSSGGGVAVIQGADVTMEGCIISGNQSTDGGGVSCSRSSLTMRRCVITRNTVFDSDPFVRASGGSLSFANGSEVLLGNCLVYENSGERGDQLGSSIEELPAFLTNCSVISEEGGFLWEDMPPVLRNCILWGSTSILDRVVGAVGEPDVTFNCV